MERLEDPQAIDAFCERAFGQPGALSDEGTRRLQSVGRVLALDLLIYNYDRLPCGDIFGNAGNVRRCQP